MVPVVLIAAIMRVGAEDGTEHSDDSGAVVVMSDCCGSKCKNCTGGENDKI